MFVDEKIYDESLGNKSKNNNGLFIVIVVFLLLVIVCLLVFINKQDDVKEIYVTESKITLTEGENERIGINIDPPTVNPEDLEWTSNSDNITISKDGVIYANRSGEATITITSKNGKKAIVTVIVKEKEFDNDEIDVETKEVVKSITLDKEELELEIDDEYIFNTVIEPNIEDNLIWSSSNPDIVSVDNGVVQALKQGVSIIKVESSNGKYAICQINVKSKEILPEEIKLDKESITINVGDKDTLQYIISPEDVTDTSLTWSSSHPDIVKVENGTIEGLSAGESIIKVKTSNNLEAVCLVTVEKVIEVESITLDKTNVILNLEESLKLNANILPLDANDKSVIWNSSNSDIVSVDNDGNVKALKEGKAIVTVKSSNNKSASCEVTVQKIEIRIFDQRNDAMLDYYKNSSSISSIYKKYKCSKNKCYYPRIYDTSLGEKVKVFKYDESTKTKTLIKATTKDMLQYIMIPNTIYYLESDSDPTKFEYVKIVGEMRMIKVDGIYNMRDLGGKPADGGIIKYGKLFRSANPNSPKNESKATEAFKNLGISVIFDLRESSSFRNQKKKMRAFEKLNSDTGYYLYSKVSGTRKSVQMIMQQIVKGKGVDYHCAIGRDRTGTVSLLLEGILGVPKNRALEDFELSYLYKPASSISKNGKAINSEYKTVSKAGGNNDQEKFINWYLSKSSNLTEDIKLINDFRTAMINGKPKTYKVVNKKCVEV